MGQNISDDEFEEVFKEVDTDNSGTIDRDEIAVFINKVTQIENSSHNTETPLKCVNSSDSSISSHSLSSLESSD